MSMYKVIQKENRELRSEIRKKDETHVRFSNIVYLLAIDEINSKFASRCRIEKQNDIFISETVARGERSFSRVEKTKISRSRNHRSMYVSILFLNR